jgi:hypothetical protein
MGAADRGDDREHEREECEQPRQSIRSFFGHANPLYAPQTERDLHKVTTARNMSARRSTLE